MGIVMCHRLDLFRGVLYLLRRHSGPYSRLQYCVRENVDVIFKIDTAIMTKNMFERYLRAKPESGLPLSEVLYSNDLVIMYTLRDEILIDYLCKKNA